jgi:hypothetical protein
VFFSALHFEDGTFEVLTGWLDQGVPIIVALAADELAHGATGGHAVVVSGVEHGQSSLGGFSGLSAEHRLQHLPQFLEFFFKKANPIFQCEALGTPPSAERHERPGIFHVPRLPSGLIRQQRRKRLTVDVVASEIGRKPEIVKHLRSGSWPFRPLGGKVREWMQTRSLVKIIEE